jgi:hypothetical protein
LALEVDVPLQALAEPFGDPDRGGVGRVDEA